MADEIRTLKEERNAVILAHNYQRPEVQDISDYIGDSLGLSRKALEVDADIIVFCGVDFMAETASILNPGRTVLLPDVSAKCPMAMMLSAEDLIAAKERFPDAETVLYVNTSAKAKAEADCICTSANVVEVVASMESDTILFGPDKNLAYYARKRTKKNIIPVPDYGVCPTHHQISLEDVLGAKRIHPGAAVVVHPEVVPEVQDIADHIASTEGMIDYCRDSDNNEFIIGTERGLVHRLEREVSGKRYYPIDISICPPMKMITLEKVRDSLRDLTHEVRVESVIASRAKKAIDRMLRISGDVRS